MSQPRAWWLACAIAGFVALATAVYFGQIPNLAIPDTPGGAGSIIAFEIVRTPADVAALFDSAPDTGLFVAAMRHATWVDALIFIPAYTLFLCAAMLAMRTRGPRIAASGVIAMLLAALFDELEGMQLFTIMADLPGSQSTIDWLIPLVRGKFALLGLAAGAIGWLVARLGGYWRIAGLIITIGAALTLFGVSSDTQAGLLGLGGAVSWLTILIVAILRLLTQHRAASPR